ncbi:PREDICTED: protein aurora borealis [Wasmannia auropunctata]|uniref:protein aurora borealis n=1 Tax=Wasmannia auropunctata TaxID=64793 RepID=UPI0005ED5CB5|nr:PREDICTED: protein aurora borealis [Wasmannia auropunctata]
MMEQTKRRTPSEERTCASPLARGTPVKRNDAQLKRLFAVLPSHITPPSKLRRFVTKNPFEPELINRLHLPAISPTIFTKVPSPMQQSPGFAWSIDELARMKPVKIEESPMQQVCSPDPELEMRAQAAIDRFFKENQIIPSPWDTRQKASKPCLPLDTPNRLNDFNSTQELSRSTKDAWSQTVLSLPQNLPENVEEVLKPFFTFTQEQNADNDDINSSNNSLRRKLFFCQDEGADTDKESFTSLSPMKMNESMELPYSPPQSGMFVHGVPLKMLVQTKRRSNGSSIVISENLSPPNMSPIHNAEDDCMKKLNKLYERIEHCSRPSTGLSSMDLSMDDTAERKSLERKEFCRPLVLIDNNVLPFVNENHVKRTEDNGKLTIRSNDKTNACDSINMEELPKSINSTDSTVHSDAVVFSNKEYDEISLKIAPETASFSRESHKRSNIMSGAFERQSISNSVQDTGYQTYSMNSITQATDSNDTSTSHRTLWNENMAVSRDNTQLSWRENMRNVFSSTPSKYNKEKGTL